ncbi:hypothetical protein CERSUDRAFT_110118 [Gelatoporia subvermispora B]|uniref:Methyltransferase domain-containing protein n=1 Tax=Ceriporiopsis subvermispora (strain B) TaxID=914234 RepID=M2RAW5_CERS8|nr:hypothetical protein CERSUDRAFT_110118 [Gelatoporia subvermispora B]
MAESSETQAYVPPPIEPSVDTGATFAPDERELAFLQEQTGIQDTEELKQHVIAVQKKALKVFPYGCIQQFSFTRLQIGRQPKYSYVLKMGKERAGAIFLDIGCAFGTDVRQVILDGYPVENVVASDIQSEFWQIGLELYRSTPETFPVPFVAGDAFDTTFLAPVAPFTAPPPAPRPDLRTLTTLTPLLGHVSFIHAFALFHLFDEAKQAQLARALAGLLSPEPGSMIFGGHSGRPEKGLCTEAGTRRGWYMFCHSPESWKELWDGQVFPKGTVDVDSYLVERPRSNVDPNAAEDARFYLMVWTVTRL